MKLFPMTAVCAVLFSNLAMAVEFPVYKSSSEQTQMIELFSSEGCSSCPPAEDWLNGLKDSAQLWKSFVPIEFHVDYWNNLGWKDPLSKAEYTDRQQSYGQPQIYTPEFFLNGKEWHPRGDRDFLNQNHGKTVGVLSAVTNSNRVFSVTFDSSRDLGPLQLFGAVLGSGIKSDVKAGENNGKLLKHEFAVLAFQKVAMTANKSHYTASITLARSAQLTAKSYHFALWVSERDQLAPIQAVAGPLD